MTIGPVSSMPPPNRSGAWLPWLIGAAIVIGLAVASGLLAAWLVAGMRAVPPPAGIDASPRPTAGPTALPSATGGLPTALATDAPRFTPSPSPQVTVEPEPFVHIVSRGESLTYIAELYEVEIDDLITLNEIRNPNRIQVGQELLIPGYGVVPSPRN